jgi:hypothetical protein
MTATLYRLNRSHDVSGVSGEGAEVATICEFSSGLIALHWNSETPSVTVYTDRRHIEHLHGHGGASKLDIGETRLEAAYRVVMPFLLTGGANAPVMVGPHPDLPDRLRLVLANYPAWRYWVALLDGSTHAASHSDVNGEIRHRWIDPSGDIWIEYFSPLQEDNQ